MPSLVWTGSVRELGVTASDEGAVLFRLVNGNWMIQIMMRYTTLAFGRLVFLGSASPQWFSILGFLVQDSLKMFPGCVNLPAFISRTSSRLHIAAQDRVIRNLRKMYKVWTSSTLTTFVVKSLSNRVDASSKSLLYGIYIPCHFEISILKLTITQFE